MRRLLAMLCLATVTSCGGLSSEIENVVTGTWRGSSTGETFVIVLQQANTTVAGTGTMTSSTAGARTLSVSGTFSNPSFVATITPSGGQPIALQGVVDGRSFVGTLTGSGFNGAGLALTRD